MSEAEMAGSGHGGSDQAHSMQMSYWRFAAMIATSTVVMYGLMYLNTYALDHVHFSEMRTWMALLMGASMAIIMLAFMLGMYKRRALNIGIFVGATVVFALSLWVVRSQSTISDADYMKAMIPHHSIAILTSERAQITDPRVRKLAAEIVAAQRKEIAEMEYLVQSIESGDGEALVHRSVETPPRVVAPAQAIRQADVARTDLEALDTSEIEQLLGEAAYCTFSYSRHGGPVLAAAIAGNGTSPAGLAKLHGLLVPLSAAHAEPQSPLRGVTLSGDGIGIEVSPWPGSSPQVTDGTQLQRAIARMRLDAGLDAGYAGFYHCPPTAT